MKKIFFSALVCLILFIPAAFSQDCGELSGDPFCNGDTDVPLDGGVGILIGLTTMYGIKKLRSDNKK